MICHLAIEIWETFTVSSQHRGSHSRDCNIALVPSLDSIRLLRLNAKLSLTSSSLGQRRLMPCADLTTTVAVHLVTDLITDSAMDDNTTRNPTQPPLRQRSEDEADQVPEGTVDLQLQPTATSTTKSNLGISKLSRAIELEAEDPLLMRITSARHLIGKNMSCASKTRSQIS